MKPYNGGIKKGRGTEQLSPQFKYLDGRLQGSENYKLDWEIGKTAQRKQWQTSLILLPRKLWSFTSSIKFNFKLPPGYSSKKYRLEGTQTPALCMNPHIILDQ